MGSFGFAGFFSWYWVYLGAAALLVILVPVCCSRNRRLGYSAFLCTAAVFLLVTLWAGDAKGGQPALIQYTVDGFPSTEEYWALVESGGGKVKFSLSNKLVPAGSHGTNPTHRPWGSWGRVAECEPPYLFKHPIFDHWGLQVAWTATPVERLVGFMCPAWFPIPFLLILPALYTRRFFKRRKVARWARENRCANCGYLLVAHRPGQKCPECGRMILPRPSGAASPRAGTVLSPEARVLSPEF